MSRPRYRICTRTFTPASDSNRLANICDVSPNVVSSRCISCPNDVALKTDSSEIRKRHLFKQMYNTVRVSSSEYSMNKAALNVGNPDGSARSAQQNNQASDRAQASVVSRINVPSRGNSRTTSLTRLRPGSLAPGGTGVDIKHNSYDRYLARIKGSGLLKQEGTAKRVDTTAVVNNKPRKYNIVALPVVCPA